MDSEGLHPFKDKVKAIEAVPAPALRTELKAYQGLITYYEKFLPNFAAKRTPQYRLLQHNVPWK